MTRAWLAAAFLLAIPLVSSAFAEVGPNYDDIEIEPGLHKFTSHYQRVQDADGSWKNYIVNETGDIIQVKSSTAFLEFNKADCSYKIRDESNNTLIPYVSWTAKRALAGTDTWETMEVNSAQCSFEIDQQPEYVTITATKERNDQKFVHTIKVSDRIKESVEVFQDPRAVTTTITHNNGTQNQYSTLINDYKLGAVQTVGGPEITINGQTINLSTSAGQFFDRNWIEQNQAKVFEIANGLNYDFDIGFNSLWGIKVYADKVSLDYNNSGDDTEKYLMIDPTYTDSGTISGGNTVFDLTYPTLTNAVVSSGNIDGTALTSGQITTVQNAINSAASTVTLTAITGDNAADFTSNFSSSTGWTTSDSSNFSVDTANTEIDFSVEGGTGAADRIYYDLGANSVSDTAWVLRISQVKFSQMSTYTNIVFGISSATTSWSSTQDGLGGRISDGGDPSDYFIPAKADNGGFTTENNNAISGQLSTNTDYYLEIIRNSSSSFTIKIFTGGFSGTLVGSKTETLSNNPTGLRYIKIFEEQPDTPTGVKGIGTIKKVEFWNGVTSTAKTSNTLTLTYTTNTAPAQVTGLSATAGNTQASLSWTAPSNGGSAITDYTVQYSTDNATWSTFADGTSTATTATVTGLTKNTLYYFRVAAVNAIGTGTYSTSASTTVLGVPDAPTSLSATAGNTQASLSWTAPSNNGGASITDYKIQYSTDNATWSTFADGTSTSTTATVTGLTKNTLYYFRVAATNSQGDSSYTSSVSTTVLGVPDAPTGLSASSSTAAQASLSWTAPTNNGGASITDYVIQYSTDNSNWSTFADGTSTSTTATVTGLTQNTLYYFRVAATNSQGNSSYSSSASVTVWAVAPGTPTGVTSSGPTTSQISLSWTQPASNGSTITDYVIQYSTDNSSWSTFADGTSTATTATVTGLNSNTLYYFRVAAVNGIGTGSYSSSATETTLANAPSAPSASTVSTSSLSLSWTAPSGSEITDYTVQYSTDDTTWNTFSDGTSTSTSATFTGLSSNTLYYLRVATVNAGGTSAYSSSTTGTTLPGTISNLAVSSTNAISETISWTAPSGSVSITDYVIQYSTNNSSWSTFADGTSNSTSATITGLSSNILYYFKVAAVNSAGQGAYSSSISDATDNPEPVTTLSVTTKGFDFVDIEWNTPTLYGATVQGYQINYTTPYGLPLTKIVNSTNSTLTTFTLSDLTPGTEYSFRVGLWTYTGGLRVSGANTANVTTYQSANFTIGGFDLESTNPNQLGIKLSQEKNEDGNNVLSIVYPTTYDMACDFGYTFAQQNQTVTNISGTPISAEASLATFEFAGNGTEVIQATCYDQESGQSAKITLNSNTIPLITMLQNFRNGTYGTTGQFGSLDLITVIVVFVSMIGFNRVNPAVGVLFAVATMFGLAYFEVISPITSGVAIVVAVLFMLAVIGTRRGD